MVASSGETAFTPEDIAHSWKIKVIWRRLDITDDDKANQSCRIRAKIQLRCWDTSAINKNAQIWINGEAKNVWVGVPEATSTALCYYTTDEAEWTIGLDSNGNANVRVRGYLHLGYWSKSKKRNEYPSTPGANNDWTYTEWSLPNVELYRKINGSTNYGAGWSKSYYAYKTTDWGNNWSKITPQKTTNYGSGWQKVDN